MRDLSDLVKQAIDDVPAFDAAVLARVATRRRRGRAATLVAGVVVLALLSAAAISRRDGSDRRLQVSGRSTTSVTPSTARGAVGVIELNGEIADPTVLAVAGDRLWVSGYSASSNGVSGPAHLQEFAAKSGKLLGDLTLPDNAPFGLQVSDGAVWVSAGQGESSTEFLKIDIARLRVVARITNLKDGALAVDANAAWVTDLNFGPHRRGLRRIDPTSGRELTIGNVAPSLNPLEVVTGSAGVWVGNNSNGNVQRIDETTNTAGSVINVAPDLAGMVELHGSLWVERGSADQVVQVAGSKASRAIDLGERVYDLATDGNALWFGTDAARVLRVDPDTGAITRVDLPAGTRAPVIAGDPSGGAVWVASAYPTPRLVRVSDTSAR